MATYSFYDSNDNLLWECTSENAKHFNTAEVLTDDVRKRLTVNFVRFAKRLGYKPIKGELEKYDIPSDIL